MSESSETTTETTTQTVTPTADKATQEQPDKAIEGLRAAAQAERTKRQQAEQAAEDAKAQAAALQKRIEEADKREAARIERVTASANSAIESLPDAIKALRPPGLTGDDLAAWVETAKTSAAKLTVQIPAVSPGRVQGDQSPDVASDEIKKWCFERGYAGPDSVLIKAYNTIGPGKKAKT